MKMVVTVTAKGQITLPKALREAAGVRPGASVNVRLRNDGGVIIEAASQPAEEDAYRMRLEDMSRRKPIRGLSTEEIIRMTRGGD
jgi:antitoxin PrlF